MPTALFVVRDRSAATIRPPRAAPTGAAGFPGRPARGFLTGLAQGARVFEPLTLTVGELAERWHLSPRQVLERAQELLLPLYFPFDGLAFDWTSDLRYGKDVLEQQELASVHRAIEGTEAHLLRHARGETGKYDAIDPSELPEFQRRLREWRAEAKRLREQAERREIARNRSTFRGYVRATPHTLWEIATLGSTAFPYAGFHPEPPVGSRINQDGRGHDGRTEATGRLMSLEPRPGQTNPDKQRLTVDDLIASFSEVKAIEAARTLAKVSPTTDGTTGKVPPTSESLAGHPRVHWQKVLFENIVAIDKRHGGRATPGQVITALRKLGDSRIPDEGPRERLTWVTDQETRKAVSKKTVENALTAARIAASALRKPPA